MTTAQTDLLPAARTTTTNTTIQWSPADAASVAGAATAGAM